MAEVFLGGVAQFGAGAGDLSEGVGDVAGAGGPVLGLVGEAEDLGEGAEEVVEGVGVAGADVEDAACCDGAGGLAGEQVGLDSVGDEGEVAALTEPSPEIVGVLAGGASGRMKRAMTPE